MLWFDCKKNNLCIKGFFQLTVNFSSAAFLKMNRRCGRRIIRFYFKSGILSDKTVADPYTLHAWKDTAFDPYNLTTEHAGGVWTDKSVFTDASAFPGVTMKGEKRYVRPPSGE